MAYNCCCPCPPDYSTRAAASAAAAAVSAVAAAASAAAAANAITIGTLDGVAGAANGASLIGGILYFQTADLTTPGLVSTDAQEFEGAKYFNSTITLPNNTFYRARDAADANDIGLLRLDSSDNTEIHSTGTNKLIELYFNGTRRAFFQEVSAGAPLTLQPRLYFHGDTDGETRIQNYGDDTQALGIHAGSDAGNTHGAGIYCYGNDNSLYPGKIICVAGDEATSQYIVRANQDFLITNQAKTARFTVDIASGDVTTTGDIFVGLNEIFQTTNAVISQNTLSGSDNHSISLTSTDTPGLRGSTLYLYGNDYASIGGNAYLITGNQTNCVLVLRAAATGGKIQFQKVSGLTTWDMNQGGELTQDATNGGLIIFNAANTTMRFNGAMGNSSKDPRAVLPDDWVQISIAGTAYYIPAYLA